MHLIDVDTFELREFTPVNLPRYAILSHTWGDDEVTFQDMKSARSSQTNSKKGFQKLRYTCEEAKRQDFQWAWVDTCCIDKSSSAELSEAINSMFNWYRDSSICFAYLSDAPNDSRPGAVDSPFLRSRWFKRGWTLQKLIAPGNVRFYSEGWTYLGDRYRLCGLIENITRIPSQLLVGIKRVHHYSVAQRMSWASNRETTRLEDRAYSLLELFDINMPLLYGEGTKAFQRLQEEIVKQTDDHSLFAWTVPASSRKAWRLHRVLAESPDEFDDCQKVSVLHEEIGEPSLMTKKGLQITAPM
ncbi:heterokaryon incompatibility protein-domain-containing protein, partial [Apodospora peruviana]